MKKYENDCCDCAVPGYPCTGEHKRVPHWYCDKCGDEFEPEELYVGYDCEELCKDCLASKFQTVAQFEGKE